MQRDIIITADGSTTIYLPQWEEHYHSKHGAVQEAYHVFIKHGLHYYNNTFNNKIAGHTAPIAILEMGFGTGLNALITALEADLHGLNICYSAIEAYPVKSKELVALNYATTSKTRSIFKSLHDTSWETAHAITSYFELRKVRQFFESVAYSNCFDVIYFDAFGARVQPELWGEVMFEKMYKALNNNGVLVTYAAKGSVRRAMISVGFQVEKLPGPPGKREMLRALKIIETPEEGG